MKLVVIVPVVRGVIAANLLIIASGDSQILFTKSTQFLLSTIL